MKNARNDVVDAWRALLILAVLGFHFLTRWATPVNLYGYDSTYPEWWRLGALGPHVFFAISGLVITMTVLRSHDALDFCFRRFSRLYPAAIVAATLTFVVAWGIGPSVFQLPAKDLLLSFTLAAPIFGGEFIDGAYWSLLVELRFYVMVALAFAVARHKFWVLIAASALFAAAVFLVFGRSIEQLVAPYISFFLLGMAAWYGLFEKQWRTAAILGFVALIAMPASLPSLSHVREPVLLTTSVAYGSTFLMIAMLALPGRLPLGPLPWLGRISYSLYLVHQVIGVSIIAVIKRNLDWPDMAAFGAATAIAIALAAAIHYLVERPAQGGLRKLYHVGRPHLLGRPT